VSFEWSEEKRLANLAKHGVDFELAALIFAGMVLVAEDVRQDYGERRFRALGEVDGDVYVVVFTRRGDRTRSISAWKAGRRDRERYQDRNA
jgi:uncharacterized DUF497 family protein